jgi:hypothetical protein
MLSDSFDPIPSDFGNCEGASPPSESKRLDFPFEKLGQHFDGLLNFLDHRLAPRMLWLEDGLPRWWIGVAKIPDICLVDQRQRERKIFEVEHRSVSMANPQRVENPQPLSLEEDRFPVLNLGKRTAIVGSK